MAHFYEWNSNASKLEPLRAGSLFFINNSPGVPGIHFIDHGKMKKAESNLEPPSVFEHGISGLRIQRLNRIAP